MHEGRTARSGVAGLAIVVVGAVLAAGCGGGGSATARGRGWIDGAPSRSSKAERGKDFAPADGGTGSSTAVIDPGVAEPPGTPTSVPPRSAVLRAGSVDDNERWDDYLLYRQDFLRAGTPVHDVDVSGRRIVTVRDRAGHPVLGARVRLLTDRRVVAEATTHADGRVFLFPPVTGLAGDQERSTPEFTAVVDHGGARAEVPVNGSPDVAVTLDADTARAPVALDVMFVIDATGSMGDEIEQLKANLASISDRLEQLPAKPDVRFAMTVFRDRGDAFVTRTFDFTSDIKAFQVALRVVEADGGGDTPESVNAALYDAVHKPAWRGGDTVSLAFLIGDAAPHLDYQDDPDYTTSVVAAAQRGIKIEPIASSGLDDQGEYIFRQVAELTGGRFSFLTYGAAGAPEPGDATTTHVKDYSVLSLDDLVVRLVGEELAPLQP